MRETDAGHIETEKILKQIEKQITAEYARAESEVRQTLADYLARFHAKDKLKRKALAKGLITQAEYDQWRIGQILVGQRWQMLADTIATEMVNSSQIAKQIAYKQMPLVYATNFNYGTYVADVLSGGRIADSFNLINRDAVAVLFEDGKFWHAPGKAVSDKIAQQKLMDWEKKQIQSVMMQGILQGESISKLATRLHNAVGDSVLEEDIRNRDKMTADQVAQTLSERNRAASIRNARTMATGVQNAGRVDSFRRSDDIAEKYGMKVRKQWFATLDGRTRHWHAELDGEVVDNDEPFVNDYGEIDYPGDPGADPANVYNCRCTCLPCIEGAGLHNSAHPKDTGRVMSKDLGGISYEDWKAGHYKQHSDKITKQDEIAEIMKYAYSAEYRKYNR